MYLIKNPGKIARIIAPTKDACNDIVNDNLSVIMRDAPDGLITRKKTDLRWELSNGSSLRLGALERAFVDGNRGGNASIVVYEECSFVKGDDFTYGVDSVIGPQLLRSAGMEIFVSTVSEDPDHPMHVKIKAECEVLGTFFDFTVFESPTITKDQIIKAAQRSGCLLSPEYERAILDGLVTRENAIELAVAMNSSLTDAFKREYMAKILRPSIAMIIPDYDEKRHVSEFAPPSACKWTITADWGGVRDLTAVLLHTYDFIGNRDLVLDEKVFQPNTPTNVIVDALKQWELDLGLFISNRFADVPGQTLIDIRIVNKYEVALPNKSDWLAGVNNLSVKFSTNAILIHPRCKFLRRSLAGGLFNKQRTDFERSKDLGHCDAIAALMYGVNNQDRSSPYLTNADLPENYFVLDKPKSGDERTAEILSPKQWASQRAFGAFRRT
jgi:hypothetical protein